MGNAAAIFAGIGGAAKGLAEGYSWQKEYEQKDRAITSREEIAKLQAEIRQMIADAVENGRNQRWQQPSGNAIVGAESRETVAGINQDAANYRHDTASGDTLEREAGSDRRLTRNLDFGYDLEAGRNRRFNLGDETTRRGQDSTAFTARRGQDIGATTTRRGQDMSSTTAQRGQDLTSETARRGQDLTSKDRHYSADKRVSMFQGLFQQPGQTPITASPQPNPITTPTPLPRGGETMVPPPAPSLASPETMGAQPNVLPITPTASNPPPQPQQADAAVDLETKRRTRFEQIKREIAERQRKGLKYDDLVKEMLKLRTSGAQ